MGCGLTASANSCVQLNCHCDSNKRWALQEVIKSRGQSPFKWVAWPFKGEVTESLPLCPSVLYTPWQPKIQSTILETERKTQYHWTRPSCDRDHLKLQNCEKEIAIIYNLDSLWYIFITAQISTSCFYLFNGNECCGVCIIIMFL